MIGSSGMDKVPAFQAFVAVVSADAQLNAVVIALFALAVVIAVTTIVYWRLTRPEKQPERRDAANE